MKKLLVVVDVQKDFVDGSLGTPEAVGIIDKVVETVSDPQYDDVVFTKDTHFGDYLDTPEGKKLPVPQGYRRLAAGQAGRGSGHEQAG